MVLEFTKRVERVQRGKHLTALILSVRNYIQHHISESIRIEDMAKTLYISRPHLSAKFKQESRQSMTDFILQEKRRRQSAFSAIPENP